MTRPESKTSIFPQYCWVSLTSIRIGERCPRARGSRQAGAVALATSQKEVLVACGEEILQCSISCKIRSRAPKIQAKDSRDVLDIGHRVAQCRKPSRCWKCKSLGHTSQVCRSSLVAKSSYPRPQANSRSLTAVHTISPSPHPTKAT
jgi:hypothetical protein